MATSVDDFIVASPPDRNDEVSEESWIARGKRIEGEKLSGEGGGGRGSEQDGSARLVTIACGGPYCAEVVKVPIADYQASHKQCETHRFQGPVMGSCLNVIAKQIQ